MDYRSLEQKIRLVVREATEKRNDEIRKKIENVGRPTDNVKDDSFKLAKQGEIKTKIIDEAGRVLPDLTQKEPEKQHSKDYLSRMPKKRENDNWKAYVKTGADWAKPENVKEEEQIDELSPELVGKVNKARTVGGKPSKTEAGERTLQTAVKNAWVKTKVGTVKKETIEEDSVAGVSTKDTPKEQPEVGKQKKENQKDLKDAGSIKGGKTEVDLNPTTDDRDDAGKKMDNDSKKATKAANAQAGVKEETMDTRNFGLPADLIKTVAETMGKCSKCGKMPCQCDGDPKKVEEELKGNQKKLDKNHNGKLDSDDFKMLRKEEVVDEASMSRREAGAHYDANKKAGNTSDTMADYKNKTAYQKAALAAKKTIKMKEEVESLDEVEQIDEISKKLAARYNNKVAREVSKNQNSGGDPAKLLKRKNREAGHKLSWNKYHNYKVKVPATNEETDPGFSEAELAHIEAIVKDME